MKYIFPLLPFIIITIIVSGCVSVQPVNKLETRIIIDPGKELIGAFDYDPDTNSIYYIEIDSAEDNYIGEVEYEWLISLYHKDLNTGNTLQLHKAQSVFLPPRNFPDSFLNILNDRQVVELIGQRLIIFKENEPIKEAQVLPILIPHFDLSSDTRADDYAKQKEQCNTKLIEMENFIYKKNDFQTIGYIRTFLPNTSDDYLYQTLPRFILFDEENIAFDLGTFSEICNLVFPESFTQLLAEKNNLSLHNPDRQFSPNDSGIAWKNKKFQIREVKNTSYNLLCEGWRKQILWDENVIWQSATSCPMDDIISSLPASYYVFINEDEFIYKAGMGHGKSLDGKIVASSRSSTKPKLK